MAIDANPPVEPAAAVTAKDEEGNAPRVEAARVEAYVQIWAKAVDTQMHFNEMSVKSRQLGLTFVAAALGVGVVLLSRQSDFAFTFAISGCQIVLHVATLIILAAAIALIGVQILDLGVYHRMLRGAVTFGEDFEEQHMKELFQLEKGMTQAISHYSRHNDANVTRIPNAPYVYTGTSLISAEVKIRYFYSFVTYSLLAAAALIFFVTNISHTTTPAHKPAAKEKNYEKT